MMSVKKVPFRTQRATDAREASLATRPLGGDLPTRLDVGHCVSRGFVA